MNNFGYSFCAADMRRSTKILRWSCVHIYKNRIRNKMCTSNTVTDHMWHSLLHKLEILVTVHGLLEVRWQALAHDVLLGHHRRHVARSTTASDVSSSTTSSHRATRSFWHSWNEYFIHSFFFNIFSNQKPFQFIYFLFLTIRTSHFSLWTIDWRWRKSKRGSRSRGQGIARRSRAVLVLRIFIRTTIQFVVMRSRLRLVTVGVRSCINLEWNKATLELNNYKKEICGNKGINCDFLTDCVALW